MNIENQLDGMCNTCQNFSIESDVLNLYAGNAVIDRTISINCENRSLCNAIKKNFEDKYSWVLVRTVFGSGDSFKSSYGVPHVAELRNGVWYCDTCDAPMEETLGIKVVAWFDMQLIGGAQ